MIKLRKASLKDEQQIDNLLKTDLSDEREPVLPLHLLLEYSGAYPFVLEDTKKKRIVGYASIVIYPQGKMDGIVATIQDVTVAEKTYPDENYQGRGLGKKLQAKLEEVARKKGVKKLKARLIWLTSKDKRRKAINMYESAGFKKRPTNFFEKKL